MPVFNQFKPSLQMRQKLVISPQMQQAMHLLQMPLVELESFLEQQIQLNPLLATEEEPLDILDSPEKEEAVEETTLDEEEEWNELFSPLDAFSHKKQFSEKTRNLDSTLTYSPSLYEFLLQQANECFEILEEREIASYIIGNLDEKGFLSISLEELSSLYKIPLTKIQNILKKIQSFEPQGIAACNLQESLLIQLSLQNKKTSLAYIIIEKHYEALLHNQITKIAKSMRCSPAVIQHTIEQEVGKLNFAPGDTTFLDRAYYIVPDATVREEAGKLFIIIERSLNSHIRFNQKYLQLLRDPSTPKKTQHFLKHYFSSARWLARNLEARYTTLENILNFLVRKQEAFFLEAEGKLLPLTMREVAEELGLHESTIARTIANKFISTEKGIFALKFFFTTGPSNADQEISSRTLQDKINYLIQNENKSAPLSDSEICQLLKKEGLSCARRTVAKYRAALHLRNSRKRKKY